MIRTDKCIDSFRYVTELVSNAVRACDLSWIDRGYTSIIFILSISYYIY
jgi:hypothetical protein